MNQQFAILLAVFSFLFWNPFGLKGQVFPADSLALLDIYGALDGPNWINHTNWLSGPIDTWYGISLTANRVSKIALPDNNMEGAVPATINNLTFLQELVVPGNSITDIPDLTACTSLSRLIVNDNRLTDLPQTMVSVLFELTCENNALTFEDLEPFAGIIVLNFSYAPQAKVGLERFQYAREDFDATLVEEVAGSSNLYFWFKNDTPIGSVPSSDPALLLTNLTPADEGTYTVEVTHLEFPDLTLESRGIHLRLYARDSLGGEYVPNQLIIEFTDDATALERDTLLAYYQATRLDVCLCGTLELWQLPDTSFLPNGDIVIGVEGTKEDALNKSKVEDGSKNYLLFLTDAETPAIPNALTWEIPLPPLPPPAGEITVAVVDVGIDHTVSMLFPNLWINENEPIDNQDNDGNCLVDDWMGYNFNDRNNNPLDQENGHGTHVAGIILGVPTASSDFEVIDLKTHGADGLGLLFNALCGIYYASEKDATVINLSWGYSGEESTVFRSAVARAGADCGALVIASAGNKGIDNDTLPHYPSGFELDNVISVAALNAAETGLFFQSNFGTQSVDIAAPGENILSTVPGGALMAKSGTSMAAAAVSRAAALLYVERPDLTYLNIREALLSSATPLASLSGQVATGGVLNTAEALSFVQTATPDTSCLMISGVHPSHSEKDLTARAFPVPSCGAVWIELFLDQPQEVGMTVYNAMGSAQFHSIWKYAPATPLYQWNGQGMAGNNLPSGVYFVRLKTEEGIAVIQLVLQ